MVFEFIFIGKTSDKYLAEGIEIYKKKLQNYVPVILTVVPPSKERFIEKGKQEEADKILSRISGKDYLIVLDENGKQFSSVEFAGELQKIMNKPVKRVAFIAGSSYGTSAELKKKSSMVLSFSRFTFTHQIIRLNLLEQVYRAMTILKGEKYHHE